MNDDNKWDPIVVIICAVCFTTIILVKMILEVT